jgi:hypothetical protein
MRFAVGQFDISSVFLPAPAASGAVFLSDGNVVARNALYNDLPSRINKLPPFSVKSVGGVPRP